MSRFDEVFAQAEKLRMADKPSEAIPFYWEARDIAESKSKRGIDRGFDNWVQALHMLAVTYAMDGQLPEAHFTFNKALRSVNYTTNQQVFERDILRDRASVLLKMKYLSMAHTDIDTSIELSDRGSAEYWAALGFKGRILRAEGKLQQALALMEAADYGLRKAGDMHLVCYNLAYVASTQLEIGHRILGRKTALAYLWFSIKYGSRKRAIEALNMATLGNWEK